MKTVIDLTDEASLSDPFIVSDPSTITSEGDEIIVSLREVELRMALPQFIVFSEAMAEYLFKDCSDEFRGDMDVNDPDRCPEREHYDLRAIFRSILDNMIDGANLSEEVRRAIRREFSRKKIDPEHWVFLREDLRDARDEVEQLKKQIEVLKKRRPPKLVT